MIRSTQNNVCFRQVSHIYAHVSFDGRVDHIMANINTLFMAKKMTEAALYLVSGGSTAFLMAKVTYSYYASCNARVMQE